MSIPPAVLSRLVEQGFVTQRGTSRRARARRCNNCGRGVISGLDGPALARDVDAEPVPLTRGGAIAARVLGLSLVALWPGEHPELAQVSLVQPIRPATDEHHSILHLHVCGFRTPMTWRVSP